MFNIKEKFEFLEDGIDFPFYNDNPKLSTREWGMLTLAVIIFTIFCFITWIPKAVHVALYFLVMVIPAIYICKGDYSLFFKKPKLRDGITIILCAVGYIVYTLIISLIFEVIGYHAAANVNSGMTMNLMHFASILIQLVGEEFFKIFILLIIMYVVYRSTNNRNLSIGIAIIGTLLIFSLAHFDAYGRRIMQILLLQGIGTIFNLYAYMKTKNFIVTYLVHAIIDSYGLLAAVALL